MAGHSVIDFLPQWKLFGRYSKSAPLSQGVLQLVDEVDAEVNGFFEERKEDAARENDRLQVALAQKKIDSEEYKAAVKSKKKHLQSAAALEQRVRKSGAKLPRFSSIRETLKLRFQEGTSVACQSSRLRASDRLALLASHLKRSRANGQEIDPKDALAAMRSACEQRGAMLPVTGRGILDHSDSKATGNQKQEGKDEVLPEESHCHRNTGHSRSPLPPGAEHHHGHHNREMNPRSRQSRCVLGDNSERRLHEFGNDRSICHRMGSRGRAHRDYSYSDEDNESDRGYAYHDHDDGWTRSSSSAHNYEDDIGKADSRSRSCGRGSSCCSDEEYIASKGTLKVGYGYRDRRRRKRRRTRSSTFGSYGHCGSVEANRAHNENEAAKEDQSEKPSEAHTSSMVVIDEDSDIEAISEPDSKLMSVACPKGRKKDKSSKKRKSVEKGTGHPDWCNCWVSCLPVRTPKNSKWCHCEVTLVSSKAPTAESARQVRHQRIQRAVKLRRRVPIGWV